MEDIQALLDSPKRSFLQQQSSNLRTTLKDFERSFANENGRKPKQADIKSNEHVAAKYKEYHRVQDVLSGSLSYEQYMSGKTTAKVKTKRHVRTDSGLGSSPRPNSESVQVTPRKQSRHALVPPEGEFQSLPSDIPILETIRPTPHRDGKVLGLFDIVPGSGSVKDQTATPSASARKRKIEELYERTPAKRQPLQVIQTPSQRPSKKQGDILDFLTGTPQKSLETDRKRHSRTPQSEGRRFELSQFFATPSAQRQIFGKVNVDADEQTSLNLAQPGCTPQRQPDATGLDATPAYLRRSTSFKDRLLSASTGSGTTNSPPTRQNGPPTLQRFRSSTNAVTKRNQRPRPLAHVETNDYDDDLEALRELEGELDFANVLVEESQRDRTHVTGPNEHQEESIRPYKKKGQKRTTRKANIRPVPSKPISQPRYVTVDDDGGESDDDPKHEHDITKSAKSPSFDEFDEDDEVSSPSDAEVMGGHHKEKAITKTMKEKTAGKSKKRAGTINPNAQSHMNYRTLKIKNKSSKARVPGRNRFGKSRR